MKRISKRTVPTSDDHRSLPLDLSTVRTTNETTPRTRERIFGLTEAPIYHPTAEEFKDPLKYIQKIQPQAEQYGIVKIVPPKEYKPEFCLNTEIFRFRTRIQKLNSMEGETRANLNYLEQIQKFHRLHGKPIQRIPHLDKRPIDLYKLKKEVAQKGGFQKVCDQKRWAEIGRVLGYTRRQCTSMSNALKSAYSRVILPYEIWLAKHKDKSKSSVTMPTNTNDDTSDNDDNDDRSSQDSNELCEVCHTDDDTSELLLCDDCNRAYHMTCLNPPLTSVPTAEWYCIKCLTAAGGDYGFEDGDEYSLSGFQSFCDRFKTKWFSKDKPVQHPLSISEEDCEDEFWRLVDDPHETCEVEYGADLHSTQHGSGFASVEHGPDDVTSSDHWNLNMIPVLPDSLFTHIKSDISGMMVPWLYIGMCFSAFCWHNEDHFTYSINYMHWGETKTWYGVPGEDTAKFEDTMKKAVPELFEQQPNLLFQLVTMLSPGRLLKEKVRVYAVDQRPGEFVVTFPKAYHSGFNHGFNFCEAVNFAPVDWVHLGLECVKRYKEYKRQPCFSHDELLVNIYKMDVSKRNAPWLKDALWDMQQREMDERTKFRKRHPQIKETRIISNENDATLKEEQFQCLTCHCYTYLSHLACSCTKKVACFNHLDELCGCADTKKNIRVRFTDDELLQLVQTAQQQLHTLSHWQLKAQQAVSGSTLPNLERLQKLLDEADEAGAPVEETRNLQSFISDVKRWESQAASFLKETTLVKRQDPQQKQSYELETSSRVGGSHHGQQYQYLSALLEEASAMAFESPLITQLQRLKQDIGEFRQQLRDLISEASATALDLQYMLDNEPLLVTDVEGMELLDIARRQHRWMNELEPEAMNLPLDYHAITRLLKQAEDCHLPIDNPAYQQAAKKAQLGAAWIKRARRLLDKNSTECVSLEHLDEILNIDRDVPTARDIYEELQMIRTKVLKWLVLFNRTMMQCQQQQLLHRPSAEDIYDLQRQIQGFPPHIVQKESATLNQELKRLDDWANKVQRLFAQRQSPPKSLDSMLQEAHTNVQHISNQHRLSKKLTALQKRLPKASQPYCICREPESGFMINCDVCQDWYHGNCVKVSKRQLVPESTYVCPVCDPSSEFMYISKRPKLEEIVELMEEAKHLLLAPGIYPKLQEILQMTTCYRDDLDAFCRSKAVLEVDDMETIKQYLRELYGLSVILEDEIEFLRKKVRELSGHRQTASTGTRYQPPHPLQQRQLIPQQQQPPTLHNHNHHISPVCNQPVIIKSEYPSAANHNFKSEHHSTDSLRNNGNLLPLNVTAISPVQGTYPSFITSSSSSTLAAATIASGSLPSSSPSTNSVIKLTLNPPISPSHSSSTLQQNHEMDKKRKMTPSDESRRRQRKNSGSYSRLPGSNDNSPTSTTPSDLRFKPFYYC